PDWDAGRQALDSLTDGRATNSKDDPKIARARAEWVKQNTTQAFSIDMAAKEVLPMVLSTVAGRALIAGGAAVGLPAWGEFLAGAGGQSLPMRLLSHAVSGAWQGGLSAGIYPEQRENLGENALTGAGIGAPFGLLGAPLRSHITPEIAQTARDYIAQGVPLHTANIPGAPVAARVMAKILGMGLPDMQALTRRAVASMGHDADTLTGATIDAAQSDIKGRLDQSAANIPNSIADGQFARDIIATARKAHGGLAGQSSPYKQMTAMLQQVYDAAGRGDLNGTVYQNLTQRGSALSNAQRDPLLGQYANEVRDSLDAALERNGGNEAANIRLARNQYRNSIILDKIKNDETGMVDPNKLFNAVRANYGGTSEASGAASTAGNAVDLGALSGGAKQFATGKGISPLYV